jgi:hypothetical protein
MSLILTIDLPSSDSDVVFGQTLDESLFDDQLRTGDAEIGIGSLIGAQMDIVHAHDGVVSEVLDSSAQFSANRGRWMGDGCLEVTGKELRVSPHSLGLSVGRLTKVEALVSLSFLSQ